VEDYCDNPDRTPTIKEWPEQERPRERLLERGPDALSDSELLALIIGGGSREESAVELSRRLLSRMDGFRDMADCPAGELTAVKGIGPAKIARIKAALEIAQRYNTEDIRTGMKVSGSRQIFEHFRHRLGDLKKETFFSLLLDTKHRLLAEEKVAVGSLNESVVHPREVFRRAVREGAAAAAFVHNHPSGLPDPSPQDRALTRRLVEAGQLMGIRVLDHVIVGDENYYSFAEHGELEPDLDGGDT
jgi:DNA repair protein RadC